MDYDRLRELQEKFQENPRRYFAPLANEYRKGGQPKRAIEICRSQLSQMPGHMSGIVVPHLLEVRIGILESGPRKDPMQIRMRQLGDVAAALACAARCVRLGAKQVLGEPESEALLADPARSLKQQARRQRSGADALGQPLAQLCMSIKVDDCHDEIWS